MNNQLTEIIVITDRSGSMQSVAEDTIGGFNTFLKEQQEVKEGQCLLTYCQFDYEYEIVHSGIPIKEMEPLTSKTFQPRGSTALLDAMGRTINEVGQRLSETQESKRPGNMVVVILTDGQENSSREFTLSQIKEMVKLQANEYDWSFIFLGQNIDTFSAGNRMGLDTNHRNMFLGNMTKGGRGQTNGYVSASTAVTITRSKKFGGLSKSFSAKEKEELTETLLGNPPPVEKEDSETKNEKP